MGEIESWKQIEEVTKRKDGNRTPEDVQKQFAAKWKSLDPEVSVAVVLTLDLRP